MGSFADPSKTSVHDHGSHPQAGSGMRDEKKSFDPKVGAERDRKLEGAMGGGGDGPDPAAASDLDSSLGVQGVGHPADEAEIAADDAGASAHFEEPQARRAEGLENDG